MQRNQAYVHQSQNTENQRSREKSESLKKKLYIIYGGEIHDKWLLSLMRTTGASKSKKRKWNEKM